MSTGSRPILIPDVYNSYSFIFLGLTIIKAFTLSFRVIWSFRGEEPLFL